MPANEIANTETEDEALAEKLATAIQAVLSKIVQREIEKQKYDI